jgi:hypothetical protein
MPKYTVTVFRDFLKRQCRDIEVDADNLDAALELAAADLESNESATGWTDAVEELADAGVQSLHDHATGETIEFVDDDEADEAEGAEQAAAPAA